MYTPLKYTVVDELKVLAPDFRKVKRQRPFDDGYTYQGNFENGYGISIIKHASSYGEEADLWEIAVLKDDDLCYTTPITDDVIGYVSDDEVLDYARKIAALKGD